MWKYIHIVLGAGIRTNNHECPSRNHQTMEWCYKDFIAQIVNNAILHAFWLVAKKNF